MLCLLIFTALRLMRIGQRPVNGIVDITNYVMFDCGQPLHAFDAQKITTQVLEPRQAHKDEKITLLDNKELALSVDDIVITDGKNPLVLAGIKVAKMQVSQSIRHNFWLKLQF